MNKIAQELMKAARKNSKLKQSEIAMRMEVKNSTISNWENGVSDPDIDSFVEYCGICGVDFIDILKAAYGDPTEMRTIECTADEIEMIRKFRSLDRRGQRNVLRNLSAEYEDAQASLGEESTSVTGAG